MAAQKMVVWVAAGAALLSLGSLGYTFYRVTCKDCGKKQEFNFTPSPSQDDDGNRVLERLQGEVWRKSRLEVEDARYVLESSQREAPEPDDAVEVQRWALAIAADRLVNASMDDEARRLLEQTITDALTHRVWRMRRTAIATAEEAGLLMRPEVASVARALLDDEHPQVAARAAGAKWDAPPIRPVPAAEAGGV